MTKAHSRHSGAAAAQPPAARARKLYRVRRSPIHGTGVFATQPIPKGARIVEYVGERVSHAEADRRYEDKDVNDNHTFLFTVDDRIVIDAGVGGNEARWINHACDPNCETVIENKRVYIEAARDIPVGAELAYDYMISRERGDPPDIEQIFACRCGSANCRGTMLLPPKKATKRKTSATKGRARSSGKASGKTAGKPAGKRAGKPGGKAAGKTTRRTSRSAAGRSAAGRPAGRPRARPARKR